MTNQKDSAFPLNTGGRYEPEFGLTKREYFAALALQGIVSSNEMMGKSLNEHYSRTSQMAISYADALINELNKDEP